MNWMQGSGIKLLAISIINPNSKMLEELLD